MPWVDPALGRRSFTACAARRRSAATLVRCHDLSEGGLAVLVEMPPFAGLGIDVTLSAVPHEDDASRDLVLLSRNHPPGSSRFPERLDELSDLFSGLPLGQLGAVTSGVPGRGAGAAQVRVRGLDDSVVINATVDCLKAAWQRPLALVLSFF